MPDLTFFGFTPTESAAYVALLDLGPATGYQLAKELSVARANAYAALSGLASKGAAKLTQSDPRVYRAVRPEDLLARIGRNVEGRMERLEQDLAKYRGKGSSSLQEFSGIREFNELAIRLATRAAGTVSFLGSSTTARGLLPIWRKRAVDGLASRLWTTDSPEESLEEHAGLVPPDRLRKWFDEEEPTLLVTDSAAIVGVGDGVDLKGVWGSAPALAGVARMAIAGLAGHE